MYFWNKVVRHARMYGKNVHQGFKSILKRNNHRPFCRVHVEALEPRVLLSGTSLNGYVELSDITTGALSGTIFKGINQSDYSGYSVQSAGDVNGDGYADFLIGANGADSNGDNTGEVYLVYGKPQRFGQQVDLSDIASGTLDGAVFRGITSGDYAGGAVAAAGDVNGDGYDDLLIGAYRTSTNAYYSGQAYLIYGKRTGLTGVINLSDIATGQLAGAIFDGTEQYSDAGMSLASAGDVNGDGRADILITQYVKNDNDVRIGEINLIYGQSQGLVGHFQLADVPDTMGAVFRTKSNTNAYEVSVATAGDVNGDGYDDFLIGSPRYNANKGEAYLVYGQSAFFSGMHELAEIETTQLHGTVFKGTATGGNAGISVASAGDVNGDGYSDLLIGAYKANTWSGTDAGKVYMIQGQDSGFGNSVQLGSLYADSLTFDGWVRIEEVGYSVSSAGDINGDGYDDWLIGAPGAVVYYATEKGRTFIIYGQGSGFEGRADLRYFSEETLFGAFLNGFDDYDHSGYSVSSAGDVDGDGLDDFLIGAYGADPNGSSSGETYLVYGQALDISTSISGRVWDDLNENGIQDVGEPAHENVTVQLLGSDGYIRDTTVTDVQGGYAFEYLVSGEYSLTFVADDGYEFTSVRMGSDPALDNDANTLTGRGGSYTLSMGQDVEHIDAGIVPTQAFDAPMSGVYELSGLTAGTLNGVVLEGIDAYSSRKVSTAGDVNGDGFDDFLVGIAYDDANGGYTGTVYLVYGNQNGLINNVSVQSIVNGDIEGAVFYGLDEHDQLGYAVSAAGDVNGDGYDDLLLGSRNSEVYLIYGQATGLTGIVDLQQRITEPLGGAVFQGAINDWLGESVCSAGDVNGDGLADILIGAPGARDNASLAGAACLIYGSATDLHGVIDLSDFSSGAIAGVRFKGVNQDDHTGRGISFAGDVNHDGYADILIGAHGSNPLGGVTFLIYGQAAIMSGDRDLSDVDLADLSYAVFQGTNFSGATLATAGDVNDDGYDDFLIGSDFGVNLIYGRQAKFSGIIDISDTATYSMNIAYLEGDYVQFSAAGDVNNDGFDDVLFGLTSIAPNSDSSGQIILVYGKSRGLTGELDLDMVHAGQIDGAVFNGINEYGYAGNSLSVGDFNGDAVPDFLIGTYGYPSSQDYTDEIYVVYGFGEDQDVDAQNAQTIAAYGDGQVIAGRIDHQGDEDWYTVVCLAPAHLFLSSHPGDAVIQVFNGDQLVQEESGAYLLNPGTYRIRVTGDVGDAYQLVARIQSDVTEVVGRHLFYHNSSFEALGDHAIARDKQALFPGQFSSFANYSGYSKGINGVIIDLDDTVEPSHVTVEDFQFHVGMSVDSDLMTEIAPPTLEIREGEGDYGTDRLILTWPDGMVTNCWIQITMLANENTKLQQDDVFYFGNSVGDSGNSPDEAHVNIFDISGAWSHLHGFNGDIADPYDVNKDGLVNIFDISAMWSNLKGANATPHRVEGQTVQDLLDNGNGGSGFNVQPSSIEMLALQWVESSKATVLPQSQSMTLLPADQVNRVRLLMVE